MQKINVNILQKPKTIQTSVKNITPINPAKGTKTILQNGIHNIKEFEFISVNVKPDKLQEKEIEIVSNGKYEVTPDDEYFLTKVNIDVNVPIPDDYIIPEGTLEIKDNGTFDVKQFEYVLINVPIPEEYIVPEGKINITNTQEIDVTQYAKAQVVDENLKAENIAEGVEVLGITGTMKGAGVDTLVALLDGTLEGVVTSDGCTTLKPYFFQGLKKLKEVHLPNVTTLDSSGYQFDNCVALEKVTLGDTTTIPYRCFRYCKALKTIHFPEVTSIGQYGFTGCSNLTQISFPKLTTTSGNVFSECSSLVSVELPELTKGESNAFYNCSSLTSVNLPKCTTLKTYIFQKCYKLTNVNIPQVTSISSQSFSSCFNLKSLIITQENSVCSLSNKNAFEYCYHLLGTVNPTYNPNGDKDGYIYVPDSLVDSYKSATNWSNYADQIKGLSDLPQALKEGFGL